MPELYTYTAKRAIDDIRRGFGDVAGVRFTDDVALRWINDAQRKIALDSQFLQRSVTTSLQAGKSVYELAPLLAARRIITYDAVTVRGVKLRFLEHGRFLSLLEEDVDQNARGTTDSYPTTATEYDGDLHLWPAPTVSVPGAIVIYGVAIPQEITLATDKLTVPDRFYEALVSLCLSYAFEYGEEQDLASAKQQAADQAVMKEVGRNDRSPADTYPTLNWDYEDC